MKDVLKIGAAYFCADCSSEMFSWVERGNGPKGLNVVCRVSYCESHNQRLFIPAERIKAQEPCDAKQIA